MTTKEAIEQRHSVRQYKDIPIESEVRDKLNALIDLGIVKYNFEAASGHKCKG